MVFLGLLEEDFPQPRFTNQLLYLLSYASQTQKTKQPVRNRDEHLAPTGRAAILDKAVVGCKWLGAVSWSFPGDCVAVVLDSLTEHWVAG